MRQRILFVAAIIAAGGIAACSSGSTVPSPAAPSGGGSSSSSGYVVSTLGSSASTVTLAPVNGTTGTVTIGGSGTVAIQSSTTTPSGAVQVQSAASHTPLYYLTINATSAVTLNSLPAFSVVLASAPTAALNEGEAVVNGGYVYWKTVGTTLAVTGSTVTVPAIAGTITLAQGQSLYLAIYSGGVMPTPAARPDNVGNTFTYTGTETVGGTYTYPSPNASLPPGVAASMPPDSGTEAVTSNITVQAAPTPFFSTTASVNDVHSVTTDAASLRSNTVTTDSWFATSATAYQLYGSSANDGAGDTYTTQFTTPVTVDELPETNGASWTNSPAAVLVETDADGTTSTTTTASNGTYTDNQTVPDGLTANIAVNADGSGTYGGTAFSTFHGRTDFIYSAPAAGVVTVSAQPTPKGTATPAPPVVIATPAAFFSPTPVLYNETDTTTTNVAFSTNSSCAVPNQYGVTGNEIVQTISRIDPVLGYTESETVTTYSQPGIGPVCLVLFDTQDYYYNYNNDDGTIVSYANVFGNGSLKSVLTESEVLNLSNTTAIVPTSIVRSAQSASQSGTLAPSTIAFARTQFEVRIAKQRRAQANALRTFLTHVQTSLGVTQ